MTPLPSTWTATRKKADYDFLLSKDGKTLLRMTKLDLTKDPYAENVKKISVGDRPVRGNKDAKVVVVNYDDFQCPFCSRMHQTLFPEILKEYGDRVQFVYKDYPLAEIHPWAMHAAVDANCLAAQNGDAYWDLADYLHANQREISSREDAGPAVRGPGSLDHRARLRNTTWTRPSCSPASRRRTTMPSRPPCTRAIAWG